MSPALKSILPAGFQLADPLWLLVLLLIPAAAWLRGRRSVPVLLVPFAAAWHRPSLASIGRLPAALAACGLTLLAGALARPQKVEDLTAFRSRGYDIMLAIDLSGSMLSEDYEKDGVRLNRLQALKPVIEAFIQQRPSDRIGVVVFSRHAYTLSPLTFDHAWLAQQLERVHIGLIEDGTAIGDALGVALARLEQGATTGPGSLRGSFIVLLTDGANNSGTLAPMQAAALAHARGIPIYTIGAGKDGLVPYPIFDDQGQRTGTEYILADLDENALRDISGATGGRFFRAADTGTIASTFQAIDQARKIDFEGGKDLVTTELFPWLAVPGLALLAAAGLCLLIRDRPERQAGPDRPKTAPSA